jgi:hypothetical protein
MAATGSNNVYTALSFAAFLTLLVAVIYVFTKGMALTNGGFTWWMSGV